MSLLVTFHWPKQVTLLLPCQTEKGATAFDLTKGAKSELGHFRTALLMSTSDHKRKMMA